jgi:hypothetical protein
MVGKTDYHWGYRYAIDRDALDTLLEVYPQNEYSWKPIMGGFYINPNYALRLIGVI